MVIVRVWEGLGNQLFQYAYAYALRKRLQCPVCLDVRHCNRGDLPFEREDIVKRKLGINHFNISLKKIDTRKIFELRCLDRHEVWGWPQYFVLKQGNGKWRMVKDDDKISNVWPDIWTPQNHTYVNAHCMNANYYRAYRDDLLKELQLKEEPGLSGELKDILESENTVSIHIRLTDYLRDPAAVCVQKYYDKAIQYIKDVVERPYFIIFTDDPQMAKERYKFKDNVHWICKDGYRDYEEMVLMSKCKHNIIAGSTFSYWGAWLNRNSQKIVVAPRKWCEGKLYEREWKTF